jgi:hypothetical protein
MAVSIAARLRAWKMRFESHKEKEIFPLYTNFRPALEPTQPPKQWVTEYFMGINRPGREKDCSSLSGAQVKKCCRNNPIPSTCLNGMDCIALSLSLSLYIYI